MDETKVVRKFSFEINLKILKVKIEITKETTEERKAEPRNK
ncbi:hypothetical protein [Mesosutterella porci]|nr:hypothetical protein [Mesosutterella sp. oilRF-744-WT-GAM-9]